MTDNKPTDHRAENHNPFVRICAGLLAHWQVLASGVLMGAGITGLATTYSDYCGMTDLTYAPAEVHGAIETAAQESGFRSGIIAAQLETESHWRSGASSQAGASGLAQFTDETWEIWGNGGDMTDPEDSIEAQGRYLAYLKERLAPLAKNDDELLRLTLAGYNAGPGAVEEYDGVPPYPETQNYVQKILDLANSKYRVTCNPDPNFVQSRIIG